MVIQDIGVDNLRTAIVKQAAKDYMKASRQIDALLSIDTSTMTNDELKELDRAIDRCDKKIDEALNFFNGNWFDVLFPNVEAEYIIKKLDQEVA